MKRIKLELTEDQARQLISSLDYDIERYHKVEVTESLSKTKNDLIAFCERLKTKIWGELYTYSQGLPDKSVSIQDKINKQS